MGAAQYVGRVGGLAVALGVGLGILLNGGTASADTDDTKSARPSSSADRDADTKQRNNINIKSAPRDNDEKKRSSTRDTSNDSSEESAERTSRSADEDTEEDTSAARPPLKHVVSQLRAATVAAPSRPSQDPPAANPAELLVAAATRRELAAAYDPAIGLVDGVITGTNSSDADNLTYTVVRNPSAGGKVSLDTTTGDFTFLPYLSPSKEVGSEKFSVLVAQQTAFTQALQNVEIVKQIAPRILVVLQQVPIVKDLLSPLIGRAERFDVLVDVTPYVGAGKAPIAFTTKIESFDGTPISVNFVPRAGLEFGDVAPTVLNGPSLATAGYINLSQLNTVSGLVPGISQIRAAGYNAITWDPRGEFASGGLMHLDSELFEARDVSAILDWAALQPGVETEPGGDPLVGMVGGSYGGGIQLTSAGIDPRIDAIAPGIAWNSLETALYPNHAFKTSWASLLALSLALTGSRPDPEVYAGIITGVLTGFLTPGQRKFLSENSPDTVVDQISVPTFFLQGTVDGLFVLQQALDNAEQLDDDVTVRMIWYCGGHGYCLDLNAQQSADQYAYLNAQTLAWMDTYVKNKGETAQEVTGPTFMWVDQRGNWFSADDLPTAGSDFFSDEVIDVSGTGGLLPIVPIFGGSGPQTQAPFPLSLPAAAESRHALEVEIPNQGTTTNTPLHVVGAPTLTLTYSGLGTSRNIYAQLVDNNTGRVLGNLVTPVPVTLDGREHTVTIDLENIAYTMAAPNDSLTLQIVDSASAYEDFTSFGIVNVSDVRVVLPTAAQAVPTTLPHAPLPPAGPTGTSTVEDLLTGAARR